MAWALGSVGVRSASIHDLYMARGRGDCRGFTVPAINVRGMAYDSARSIFRTAIKLNAGAFLLEIARSEIVYTDQRPAEYVAVMLAAALREGFRGPVFIQGDHFQVNAKKYAADAKAEVSAVKALATEAIEAGFYNVDIDTSTLVDLRHATLEEQQRLNYEVGVEITRHVRALEPRGVTISLGGEIGEVGTANSTVPELQAFMTGYNRTLASQAPGMIGLSKISVQSGTSHGGVVLADGSIADVKLDFNTLRDLGEVARREFGLSGAVQHGASTLPDDLFGRFPEVGTAEIHLATGFQNALYDHPAFPAALRSEIAAGVRFVFGNPALRTIGAATATSNLFSTMANTLLFLFAIQELHMSEALIGLSFTISGIGGLVAAATASCTIFRSKGFMGFSLTGAPVRFASFAAFVAISWSSPRRAAR